MKSSQWSIVFILLMVLAAYPAAVTPAAAGEIAPDLAAVMAGAAPDEQIPVIVQLQNRVNVRQFKQFKKQLRRNKLIKALKQQAAADLPALEAALGGRKAGLRQLWLINGVALKADPQVIRKLADLKAVASIRLDGIVTLADPTPTGSGTASWNMAMIQADLLWSQGYAGQGVVVAGMDTGVDAQHNALAASFRGGANSWFDPNGQHATPFDADGHGTQTMGVLVGGDGMGVAPQAQWIAVKIFDDAGTATFSGIHSGFQWLLDPDADPATDDAPDVVNNSWGFHSLVNQCMTEFEPDIATLRAAEIGVVFAAGNSGPAAYTSLSPANNAGSLAVGALDNNAQVIPMSSTGPSACGGGLYPQLTAPGFSIYTAGLTYGGIFPDMSTYASGTSLAAPHIAGAMALLLSASPTATLAELEQALWNSALDLGLSGADDSYGHGLVQAAAALDLLGGGTPPPDPPVDPPPVDPPAPVCIDNDNDGFFSAGSDPVCGQPVDCADSNPAAYPGAPEIVKDGIDQDCNGYDLTIAITRAIYNTSNDQVVIWATSTAGAAANLSADIPGIGVTALTWNSTQKRWQKSVGKALRKGFNPAAPGMVRVFGPEGERSAPIVIK